MTSVNQNPAKREKYGLLFPADASDLDIELLCYRLGSPQKSKGFHFRKCVDFLWNHPGSSKQFIWHPWAEEMLDASIREQYLAVGGCASSGKTDFFAVEALVEWLCAPHATQCLITSTSLKDSRKRIWSTIEDYFNALENPPGTLVSSMGVIKFVAPNGKPSDKYGITLIAADESKEKDAIGKMMGFKAVRLRLYADELPELAPAILNTAYSNLARNADFKMRGLGNPKSHYDAFGLFATPADGWKSVNETMYRWPTARGYFIRFNAERSPNVLAGRVIYEFLPKQKDLDDAARDLGPASAAYYRMLKGFWCPTGIVNAIYAETEIEGFRGAEKTVTWKDSQQVKCASLDPAFTNGGDKTILRFGISGEDVDGIKVLFMTEIVPLFDDASSSIPRTHQLAQQVKAHCESRGILPKHFAMDVTGAGGPFADVLAVIWSADFHRVYFGGAASDRPVSVAEEDVACSSRYTNRVTELWWGGKELLRGHQLRGLDSDTIRQMTERVYNTLKRGGNMMIEVESKVLMKARGAPSPDMADAMFVLIDLARERMGFSSSEKVARTPVAEDPRYPHTATVYQRFDVAALANRNLIYGAG
jgi:hypothetical protein